MAANTAVKRRLDLSVSNLQRSTNETKVRRIKFVPARSTRKADDDGFSFPETYFTDPDEVKQLVGWKSVQNRGLGLRNCGNTCYLNSVIQALTHSSAIANDAMTGHHTSSCNRRKANLFCGYCQLLTHVKAALGTKGRSDIAPEPILRQLKLISKNMRFGRQEDSHEFLRQLIDSCVTGELPIRLTSNPKGPLVPALARSTTFVGQLFSGYLQSQVTCGSCGNISRTFDPYMDISLEIQDCASLTDCFRRFTKADSLAGPNAYKCSKCEKRVSAKKQMLVHRCPPMLSIQLKRFNMMAQKINKKVRFEPSINMSPFLSSKGESPFNYSLYAVIVHEGSSMGSGHYVCYAKAGNGVWYLFNDSHVQQVSEQTVLNQSAYILMYESKDNRCFYPSHKLDAEVTPTKTPSTVTVSTPTGSAAVQVLNKEDDSDDSDDVSDSSSDDVDEDMAEQELVPTSVSLNKRVSAIASYMKKMTRAVVPASERKVLRMLTVMRQVAKAKKNRTMVTEVVADTTKAQTSTGTQPTLSQPSYGPNNGTPTGPQKSSGNKWGTIAVKTWDDGDSLVANREFKSIVAHQTAAAEPGSRSQYDVEYDLGKSMHNPRSETAAGKGLPESLTDSFNALVRGDVSRRTPGKGKGKGKGKGGLSWGGKGGKGRSWGGKGGKGKGKRF